MKWENVPIELLVKIGLVLIMVALVFLAGAWAKSYLVSHSKVSVVVG